MKKTWLILIILISALSGSAQKSNDIVLFDFENGNISDWEMVGKNPLSTEKPLHKSLAEKWARGPVGFIGNYYLETGNNEGRHDYNPDGTIISPPFKINRAYLNFYLGGEVHPDVKVSLLVDGKEVREAYGNNFYDLQLRGWKVSEFRNKQARFCIKDESDMRSVIRLDHIYLSNTPPPSEKNWVHQKDRERSSIICPGEFKLAIDNRQVDPHWKTKNSTLVYGLDSMWHLFFTGYYDDRPGEHSDNNHVMHAIAKDIQGPWKFMGSVLQANPQYGENFIDDPFVMVHDGKYYMYYVGGGNKWSGWYEGPDGKYDWHLGGAGDQGPYHMYCAISSDGSNWERVKTQNNKFNGRIFTEKPFALSPYVIKMGDEWVMYYASNKNETVFAKHAIGYRTSKDLINWSYRHIALLDWDKNDGKDGNLFPADAWPASPWPEHTFFRDPIVFNSGKTWYMLAGPINNYNLSRYHNLRIYKSDNPLKFENHYEAQYLNKRVFVDGGSRIVIDNDNFFITTTNDMSGGIWIAPLYWGEKVEIKETNLPRSF